MRSYNNRRTIHPAALGLLVVLGWDVVGDAGAAEQQPVTVTAKVLDLLDIAADGSLQFHVEVESGQKDGPAAMTTPKSAAVLFEDDFDSGRRTACKTRSAAAKFATESWRSRVTGT